MAWFMLPRAASPVLFGLHLCPSLGSHTSEVGPQAGGLPLGNVRQAQKCRFTTISRSYAPVQDMGLPVDPPVTGGTQPRRGLVALDDLGDDDGPEALPTPVPTAARKARRLVLDGLLRAWLKGKLNGECPF